VQSSAERLRVSEIACGQPIDPNGDLCARFQIREPGQPISEDILTLSGDLAADLGNILM
jgi:hypothetical protein